MSSFAPLHWRHLVEHDYRPRLTFLEGLGIQFCWRNVFGEEVRDPLVWPAVHTFQARLADAWSHEVPLHPLGAYNAIHLLLDVVADQLILLGIPVPEIPFD